MTGNRGIPKDKLGTGSHPAIRFEQVPIVEGSLHKLNEMRASILRTTEVNTFSDFGNAKLDLLLGEALYAERSRLKRDKPTIFTASRKKSDQALWAQVQSGLLKPGAEVDRQRILRDVIHHYGDEIGGHFNNNVYWFATRSVPWFFSWLLNAASVQRFLPWGMTEALASRLTIQGEVSSLQRLAQKGTILLVPTHQSNIDSVLIGYIIYLMRLPPFAYGAGLNLFSNPVLSFFMSNLGAYTVDRKKNNPIYKQTLKHFSTELLERNIHSIFFPGGGRSRSGAIESRLKLGLLGTALDAQIANLKRGRPNPNVYIVPMVMSYHFVLEAASLIEDYLVEAGKHRFLKTQDESSQFSKVFGFFWKLFSSQTGITVRVGRALDVFGNFVDEEGRSIGPNGTTIDPRAWLTSGGELRADRQRDQEYTRELGDSIAERFHRENTVLSSHLVAFSFFETLRGRYPDLDLFRFLRLSESQRTIPRAEFLQHADRYHERLRSMADRGQLYLSNDLLNRPTEDWVRHGIKHLGLMHEAEVLRTDGVTVWTEDMTLLYYYRNRLAGYGLSRLADSMEKDSARMQAGRERARDFDAQGFLA
jgi:glycerol-3-phosphate O-acyltransferase